MRCKECNVDLPEDYTKCPLCGSEAANEPPVLDGMKTGPYPVYSDELLTKSHNIKSDFPFKYILRAVMPVCLLLWLIYFITKSESPVSIGVAALTGGTAVIYFVLSLKEKGRLLHYSVSLLATVAFQLLMLVLSLITGTGKTDIAVSLGVAVVLFAVLFALRPKRMSEQLQAIFNI